MRQAVTSRIFILRLPDSARPSDEGRCELYSIVATSRSDAAETSIALEPFKIREAIAWGTTCNNCGR